MSRLPHTRTTARRWLAPALAVALLAAGACTARQVEPTGPELRSSSVAGRGDVQALRALRDRWRALGVTHYQFVLARDCFCLPEVTQPAVVEVRDGTVVRATAQADGRALDTEHFLTIDEIFARSIEAAERGETVAIEHDAEYAYPTTLTVGSLAADAGVVYRVSGVRRMEQP